MSLTLTLDATFRKQIILKQAPARCIDLALSQLRTDASWVQRMPIFVSNATISQFGGEEETPVRSSSSSRHLSSDGGIIQINLLAFDLLDNLILLPTSRLPAMHLY